MKILLLTLILLYSYSLYGYDSIDSVGTVDDLRIYSVACDNCFLNDSIVILSYYKYADTNNIVYYVTDSTVNPRQIVNYNINTKSKVFTYENQNEESYKYINFFNDINISEDKSKLIAVRWSTKSYFNDRWDVDYHNYNDSIFVFNTNDGTLDTILTFPDTKVKGLENMYNGNISFFALKENNSNTLTYKYEYYAGELDLSNYSTTFYRTPKYFEELSFDTVPYGYISYARILKSYKPGVEKQLVLKTNMNYVKEDISYEIISYEIDDSLMYDDKHNDNLWTSWGNENVFKDDYYDTIDDSLFLFRNFITKNDNMYSYANIVNDFREQFGDGALIIGIDEEEKILYISSLEVDVKPFKDNIYLYDYKNGNVIDSLISYDFSDHPVLPRFYISRVTIFKTNDSTLLNILTGRIFIYHIYSNLNTVDYHKDEHINIFPNPTNDIINIVTETPINIELFDIFGNKILQDYNAKIDISHLSPGTYYIRFLGQTKMVVKI